MKFQFDNLTAFLAMDGHGWYVWTAYGVSLLVMVWLVVRAPLKSTIVLQSVRNAEQRMAGRHPKSTPSERGN